MNTHLASEIFLVVLENKHIVPAPAENIARNRMLRQQRISGDHFAIEVINRFQQRDARADLVGVLLLLTPSESSLIFFFARCMRL